MRILPWKSSELFKLRHSEVRIKELLFCDNGGGGGGAAAATAAAAIYSNGFFVRSILADRYIHRR